MSQYKIVWLLDHNYLDMSDDDIDDFERWKYDHKDWLQGRCGWWSERKWLHEFNLCTTKPSGKDGHIDADELREKITLSEVIKQYTQLHPRGEAKWSGRCPFHSGDGDTSISVDDRKGVWMCFGGCGGGNVYHFMMRMEKLDFCQALSLLNKFVSYGGIQST